MEIVKAYSKRCLFMVMVFAILFLIVVVGLYTVLGGALPRPLDMVGIGLFFLACAILQWLVMTRHLRQLVDDRPGPATDVKAATGRDKARQGEGAGHLQQRLFLHLLSILQRDGRLMDFLSEDLDRYDDTQIGTAARSIHANCRKGLERYIKPKPILDQEEGQEIEIKTDFDPTEIELTGNVVGQPPFRGIVRHRGWRCKPFELPTLSPGDDPLVIAPAQVEVP